MMIHEIFSALGFREEEANVYLSLLDTGPITAGRLARITGLARPTLYGYLDRLRDGGLVTEGQRGTVKTFTAEPAETLEALMQKRVGEMNARHEALRSMIPELSKRGVRNLMKPRLSYFAGSEGLRTVLEDVLDYRDTEMVCFWPMDSIIEAAGAGFLESYSRKRIERKITMRALWPESHQDSFRAHPFLGHGGEFLCEVRIAPPHPDFTMGYVCYADKVCFISSRLESFGFIMQSNEMAKTIKVQHRLIWNMSEPLAVNVEDPDSFLKGLASAA